MTTIDDEEISVNCKLHVMPGYSDHAAQRDLLHFVYSLADTRKLFNFILGEQSSREAFTTAAKGEGYTAVD